MNKASAITAGLVSHHDLSQKWQMSNSIGQTKQGECEPSKSRVEVVEWKPERNDDDLTKVGHECTLVGSRQSLVRKNQVLPLHAEFPVLV